MCTIQNFKSLFTETDTKILFPTSILPRTFKKLYLKLIKDKIQRNDRTS